MKHNLAEKREPEPVHQTTGTVVAVDPTRIVVRTAEGRMEARRARSCLVEPRPGDEALLCIAGSAVYVLAILEGAEAPTTLAVDGDLSIKLGSGRLSLAAQDGVAVVSGKDVSVAAPEISVHATVGRAVFDRLGWLASAVEGEVERARLLAGSLDRVVGRITERVKRVYRKVEELDHLQAESVDWEARKNIAIHCDNALLTADKLVKLDGDQIHLG
jgi:hypothetical protein